MDDNYFKREKLTAPWKWRRHVQDAEIAAAETRTYQKGIYVEKQVDRSVRNTESILICRITTAKAIQKVWVIMLSQPTCRIMILKSMKQLL